MVFRLLSLSRNGQFSVLELDLNFVVWEARELEGCSHNILLYIFMHIQSILILRITEVLLIDTTIYLPWFEGSDHWCAWWFTVTLLQNRGIIRETVDSKVEGFVENVRSHLCGLFYEWDSSTLKKLCFVNAGEWDASKIAVFIPFQKEAYTSSTTRRVMLRATSIKFECVVEISRIRRYYHNWKVWRVDLKGTRQGSARTIEKFLSQSLVNQLSF